MKSHLQVWNMRSRFRIIESGNITKILNMLGPDQVEEVDFSFRNYKQV